VDAEGAEVVAAGVDGDGVREGESGKHAAGLRSVGEAVAHTASVGRTVAHNGGEQR
jgi:hypothetical protein